MTCTGTVCVVLVMTCTGILCVVLVMTCTVTVCVVLVMTCTVTLCVVDEDTLHAHRDYSQVVLDVNRSLKRFPPGMEETVRLSMQDQLVDCIMRVLCARPQLHYYQVNLSRFTTRGSYLLHYTYNILTCDCRISLNITSQDHCCYSSI